MDDKVQIKSQFVEKYVFHFGLIKLLVLEELKKINRDQSTFLLLANYDTEVVSSPSKRILLLAKPSETPVASSKKRKRQKDIVKDKEIEKTKEIGKGKEKKRDEHEQETAFNQGFPDDDVQIIEDTTNKRPSKKFKGKKLQFSPDIVEKSIPGKPVTTSTPRKLAITEEGFPQPSSSKSEPKKTKEIPKVIHHKEKTIEQIEELKSQLQQAQQTISNLYEENRQMKVSLSDHMDLCQDVLLKAKIMAKKTLPLHRQVKNLYRLNMALQEEVGVLQEDNKAFE